MDFRCRQCGTVYNLFTGTLLTGVRWPCSTIFLLRLRGFAQETASRASGPGAGRGPGAAPGVAAPGAGAPCGAPPPSALPDAVVEADELYQNAGEKRGARAGTRLTRRAGWPTGGAGTARSTTTARPVAGVVGRAGGR